VFKDDNSYWEWMSQIKFNIIARISITISLLDEADGVIMVWNLANAWPIKVVATDLKAEGNEVAIETIEIAHEGLTIALG